MCWYLSEVEVTFYYILMCKTSELKARTLCFSHDYNNDAGPIYLLSLFRNKGVDVKEFLTSQQGKTKMV